MRTRHCASQHRRECLSDSRSNMRVHICSAHQMRCGSRFLEPDFLKKLGRVLDCYLFPVTRRSVFWMVRALQWAFTQPGGLGTEI